MRCKVICKGDHKWPKAGRPYRQRSEQIGQVEWRNATEMMVKAAMLARVAAGNSHRMGSKPSRQTGRQ